MIFGYYMRLFSFRKLILFFIFLSASLSSKEFTCETFLEKNIPIFSQLPGWEQNEAVIVPFGDGMTNQNYLLTIGSKRYFVRSGSSTRESLGTNSDRERISTQFGSNLDLSPPILVDDPDRSVMIMPYIESQPVDLHQEKALGQTIELLKKLHSSQDRLPFTATPEDIISSYIEEIKKIGFPLSPVHKAIIDSRPKLTFSILAPCHLDIWSKNVLNDGTRLWLIDWEYGAMSEPFFDLASLASADFFTDEEMDKLLTLYTNNPSKELRDRLQQLRILADIRWGLWALIQMHYSPLDLPYDKFANDFFTQAARRLML